QDAGSDSMEESNNLSASQGVTTAGGDEILLVHASESGMPYMIRTQPQKAIILEQI
ncbi:hypothetical protein ACJX0J_039659, partial [Zea mays]